MRCGDCLRGMDKSARYFAELLDPRVEPNREHVLKDILLIAIAAADEADQEDMSALPAD